MRLPIALVLTSSLLAACGGDDDPVTPVTPDAAIDGSNSIDAANPDAAAEIDAPTATCSVSTADFGDKGALSGAAIFKGGNNAGSPNDDLLEFDALLEAAQPSDAVVIQLYAGYGAFTGGAVRPGTYQITGDELNFATCGVCVLLATNVTNTGYEDDYMATGGTVTITAAGTAVGQPLTGTLTNINFHHVSIDGQTGETTQSPDTCTSKITNATFTGNLQASMNAPKARTRPARR